MSDNNKSNKSLITHMREIPAMAYIIILGAIVVSIAAGMPDIIAHSKVDNALNSGGVVERWNMGKTLSNNNELLILTRIIDHPTLGTGAFFEYYAPNALTSVQVTVPEAEQFEFGGQNYILLRVYSGHIEVMKISIPN